MIHSGSGKSVACDLCYGEPKCVEFCPEEALELVCSDEEAEKRLYTPFSAGLPGLYERAAVMCSGLLPTKTSEGLQYYKDVPENIGNTLAYLCSHD